MTVYRLILPTWAQELDHSKRPIIEGQFSDAQLLEYNQEFYNIHYLPNYPKKYNPSKIVDGKDIDVFEWVFVDCDLKDGVYKTKEDFIASLDIPPTKIIDSGNGIHAYWKVTDLDAMSFLRLQRRLLRKYRTDEAVAKLFQLMRPPGFVNTKYPEAFKAVELLYEADITYTAEQLSKLLPIITPADEEYCVNHYNKVFEIGVEKIKLDKDVTPKFALLLSNNEEVKHLISDDVEDRSKADYRLGHLMFADGFTKQEAASVLVNTNKAVSRSPLNRMSYAQGIIDKIWTYEEAQDAGVLSHSIADILSKAGDSLKGTRFPCHRYIDATVHGFRLGQVIGLVAGSGVGKTAMALNMFQGFVKNNPDYIHFFIPLEQPANEIADRWQQMCGENVHLHEKVHVMSNYDDKGGFRHLSLAEIKEYLLKFQAPSEKYPEGRKIGCVVIDHIGALKKKGQEGENQGIMDICHEMKAFAVQTNTMLVMQSQSSREKAGIGDLEIGKDAAYGTVYFESYCDYLITIWQPLKRCYEAPGCPKVTAFKFCKIRHKKAGMDSIEEDTCYRLIFDPRTEYLRMLTEEEEKEFDFYQNQAINIRKRDRKTDVVPYKSISWTKGSDNGEISSNSNTSGP